jgi:UDP-3-O-[3-hydroxymyristoyl] glucosamine N-acyltransferase
MLRLSEIALSPSSVIRDADFDRTGFASASVGRVLCCAAAPKYLRTAVSSAAITAVVTTPELAADVPDRLGLIVDDDPEIAFYVLHNHLARAHGMRTEVEHEVDPTAVIDPSALIEHGCRIGPGVHVEARAIIHAGTVLEAGVHVAEGAQIGCDGLFVRRRPGFMLRAEHMGGVRIGAGSVVLAEAVVQRPVFAEFTELGPRVAIGPRTSVAHGVIIGPDTSVAGGATLAGSSRIGAGVWIGPGAVISSEIEIGDGARIELGAVVGRSVPAGERQSGFFARSHRVMLRIGAALTRDHG